MIGGSANESEIAINGHKCIAVLDTGSTVSTISETFYQQHFADLQIHPLEVLLEIEAAGRQHLPYSGYVELDVNVPGILDAVTALLLVVTAVGGATRPRCRWGEPIIGSFIRGHTLSYYGNKSEADCKDLCDRRHDCKSIDWLANRTSNYVGCFRDDNPRDL